MQPLQERKSFDLGQSRKRNRKDERRHQGEDRLKVRIIKKVNDNYEASKLSPIEGIKF